MEENHNLIYSFLHKHNLSIDEYYDIAAIGLCRAAITYNTTKANFSTYAYKCMCTYVFCEMRKQSSLKRIPQHLLLRYQDNISNDEEEDQTYESFIPSNEDVESDALLKVALDEYINNLNPRDKEIIKHLSNGYSHQKIALKFGCSRSLVSMIKRRLINYLQGE